MGEIEQLPLIARLCSATIQLFVKHLKRFFTQEAFRSSAARRFASIDSEPSLPRRMTAFCSAVERATAAPQTISRWADTQGWTDPPPTLKQSCRRFRKSLASITTILSSK
jgi:hypothetical protein